MRRIRLTTMCVVLLLVAAACSDGTTDGSPATTAGSSGTTAAGSAGSTAGEVGTSSAPETLVIASNKQWESREPWRVYDDTQTSPGLRNVIEGLLDRDPITNDIVPALATSYEQIDDLTWRFTIREGVQFHDGSPLTVEDVVHSINETWAEGNAFTTRSFMGPQITAEVAGDFLVDVITAEPDPIVPNRLYFQGIWQERQFTEDRDAWAVMPIGTGPYAISDDNPLELNLTINSDWWGDVASLPFENIRLVYRDEDSVRFGMVQTGEAHFSIWNSAESCNSAAGLDGIECRSAPSVETLFMRLDLQDPDDGTVMSDQRVRLAMQLAIDYETILDAILGGQGTLATQMAGPSALGWNPDLVHYGYDPDRARELLDEAAADGVPVYETTLQHVSLVDWYPRSDEIGEAVNGYLREVGLEVEFRIVERDEFISTMATRPPVGRGTHFFVGGHGNEIFDYAASLNGHLSCASAIAAVCVPEFDEMIQDASVLTGNERDEALQELARIAHENVYTGPALHLDFSYILDACIGWEAPLHHRIQVKEMTWNC